VFGSTLWRTTIVADNALDRAVSAVAGYGAPFWGLQRTPRGGEQDRRDFEMQFRIDCHLGLLMRRN
jgi:hypothetical protein